MVIVEAAEQNHARTAEVGGLNPVIIACTLVLCPVNIAQATVGKETSLLAASWEKNVEVAMEAEKKFVRAAMACDTQFVRRVEAVPGNPAAFVTAAGRGRTRLVPSPHPASPKYDEEKSDFPFQDASRGEGSWLLGRRLQHD